LGDLSYLARRPELNRLSRHLYTKQERTNSVKSEDGAGQPHRPTKKYLTFVGILLLIPEVRCGNLVLSEGCALHCPTYELRLAGRPTLANCADYPDPSNSTGHRFPMLLGISACTASPIQLKAVRQHGEQSKFYAQEM
jgi:hypothetical protein